MIWIWIKYDIQSYNKNNIRWNKKKYYREFEARTSPGLIIALNVQMRKLIFVKVECIVLHDIISKRLWKYLYVRFCRLFEFFYKLIHIWWRLYREAEVCLVECSYEVSYILLHGTSTMCAINPPTTWFNQDTSFLYHIYDHMRWDSLVYRASMRS